MEIVCEESVHIVGAELELQQDGDTISQCTQGPSAWIIPKHYDLQEDSSEDEDNAPSQALRGGDCVCCVCGERFSFLARLIEHFGVHGSDVRCHLCQVTFPRVISLALHLENSHPGYRLFCEGCGLAFRTSWHMNEHMEKHARRKGVPGLRSLSAHCEPREEEQEQGEEVEEAVVEHEEMDVKYLEEEQEVTVMKIEVATESLIPEPPEKDCLALRAFGLDHNYFCTRRLPKPTVPSKHTSDVHGSVWETVDNVKTTSNETLYVNNNKSDAKESSRDSESEGAQGEMVEVVVLRNLPQSEGRTSTSVLEAAYEKVMKSERQGCSVAEAEGGLASAVLESAPVELNVKVEDEYEDCCWEQGPIQEEVVKEEDEDSIPSSDPDDGDSLPPGDSVYNPEKDLESDTDSVASTSYSSDVSADGSQRSRGKGRRSRATGSRRKRVSCDAGRKPLAENLSGTNAARDAASPDDGSHCSSCGLRRGGVADGGVGGGTGCSRCAPLHACCLCGLTHGSKEQLLKHQANKHPSTKYVCASCLRIFPDQNFFVRHTCCSKPKAPAGPPPLPPPPPPPPPPPTPAKDAGSSTKNLPLMILNFVPSASPGGHSQPPLGTADMPTLLLTNNVISVVNPVPKLGAVTNSSLPVLPSKPSSPTNHTVPVQVVASMSLNREQKVTGLVLKGAQAPGAPLSTVTRAETRQCNAVTQSQAKAEMVAPSPTDRKPVKMVFQGVVVPQQQTVPASQPARVPALMTPLLGASSVSAPVQSRAALRIPTYPCASTRVSVSFSPTPIQFPAPVLVSAKGPKVPPPENQLLARCVRPITLRLPAPCPSSRPAPPRALVPAPLSGVASTPARFSARLPSSASPSPSVQAQGPLKIVAMFVNQSQELALQKRLRQSWRSKAVFPCRQCGAVSRQPSLGVRHRYQHRGPRRHRCQCGRAFQRLLHLLRHQVQHAEAVRYVCAACGRTFQGTHRLGRHRPDVIATATPGQPRAKTECRNVFRCNCGQVFARPAALLWHMLKNSKSHKKRLKKFLI